MWRLAANTLNKQYVQPTRGVLPAWGLSKVLTTPRHRNWPCYEMEMIALWPRLILSCNLSNGKET